ncbi:MAG: hypothetical protein ACRC7H_08055, partial [Plesiomonas shigelloides]
LEIGCQAKVSKLKFIHLFYICIPEHVFNDSKWIQSVDFIDCKNPEPSTPSSSIHETTDHLMLTNGFHACAEMWIF